MCAVMCVLILAACAHTGQAPVEERPTRVVPPPRPAPVAQPVQPPAPPEREVPTYTVKPGDTLYLIALDHGHDYKDLAAWNNIENANRIRVGQVLRLGPPGLPEPGAPVTGNALVNPISPNQSVEARPLGAPGTAGPATAAAANAAGAGAAVGSAKTPPRTGNEANSAQAAGARPEPRPGAADDDDKVDWAWPAQGKILGSFSEATNKGVDIAAKLGDPVTASAAGKVVYSGSGLRGYGKLIVIKHNATYFSAYAHNREILVKEGQQVGKGQKIAEIGNTDADQPMLHFEIRRQGKPVDPLKYLPARG
jgi:lipoprotein NlpD